MLMYLFYTFLQLLHSIVVLILLKTRNNKANEEPHLIPKTFFRPHTLNSKNFNLKNGIISCPSFTLPLLMLLGSGILYKTIGKFEKEEEKI